MPSPVPGPRLCLLAATATLLLLFPAPGCRRPPPDPAARALEKLKAAKQSLTADDFLRAAARGDADAATLFLRAGLDRNGPDARGRTALMAAAEAGKTNVVKLLLDENANPNVQDRDGATALLLAARADQADAARLLIEANADVTLKGTLNGVKNWTPLSAAVYENRARTVKVLLDTSRDRLVRDGQLDRALLVACYLGHNDLIKALLDRGANVNAKLDRGQTPLMCAATAGKPDTVALLLARGADAKAVNADQATAGILAMQRGFTDLARMLDAAAQGQPVPAPGSVAASQAPAPEDTARVKQEAAEAAGSAMEEAFLKQKNVDPKALLTKDTGLDSDQDGFTDDEELAAGTDPNDPASHPPLHTKLRMKKLDGQTFPALFEGIDERTKKARVALGGAEVALASGEKLPNLPYKVSRIRPRRVHAKDTGQEVDASELTLANTETGQTLTLIKSLPANSPDSRAVLALELANGRLGAEREVRAGEEFSLPGDGATRYKVLDIRPAQVVLKVLPAGQTVTVGTGAEPTARR